MDNDHLVPLGTPICTHEWKGNSWSDLCLYYLSQPIDLEKYCLSLRLFVEGVTAVNLRLAIGSLLQDGDWSNSADFPLYCQPGMNEFRCGDASEWRPIRGDVRINEIDHFTVGGNASNCIVTLWAHFEEIPSLQVRELESVGRNMTSHTIEKKIPSKSTNILYWSIDLLTGMHGAELEVEIPNGLMLDEYERDVVLMRNSFPREYWEVLEKAQGYLFDFLINSEENKISIKHIERMISLIRPGIENIELKNARTIEIGCGGTNPLATSMLFYLNGAAECWAVDIEPLRDEGHAAKGILRLLNDAMMHPDKWNISGISSEDFARRIARCDIAALDAGELYNGIRGIPLRHIVGSLHDLPSSSFDFMYSIDVLEHVDFYRDAARKFYSILAPGGVACHHVDFSDHSFASGQSPHRWSFLTSSGGSGGGINRIRLSQWMDAFDKAGLTEIGIIPVMEEPPADVFSQIAPEYRNLSPDDIRTLWATIIYRKI